VIRLPERLRLSAVFAGALAFLFAQSAAFAADSRVRAAPMRPGESSRVETAPAAPSSPANGPTFVHLGGIEYVRLIDVARALELSFTSANQGRQVTLTAPGLSAGFSGEARECVINRQRVFLGEPAVFSGQGLCVSRLDFEKCLIPLLRPSRGVAPLPAPRIVVLDPGHGGKDTGTSVSEKIYALDVARRAKALLDAAGYRVILTRDSDVFVDLPQRAAIANVNRADVFVSLHFNALPRDTRTSGVEVFSFAPQFQRSANAWSAMRRSDAETFASPVNRFDHFSVILASAVHRRFLDDLKSYDRGKKLAHWGVLRPLNCPGILVECGFLTSEVEARLIATPSHRQRIAQAVAQGIMDYAGLLGRTSQSGR
jgi:N-acetylmuramoyl-L-alanine amidase